MRGCSGDLAEQLRMAVRESRLSGNRLAEIAGVSQGIISRFVRAERTITIETASKLADALGLELRPKNHEKGG